MSRSLVWFSVTLALLSLAAPHIGRSAVGQDVPGPSRVEVANLQDQLEKGLKARRPQEFRFIRTVVGMVERDVLSLELVKSTFQWARKKAKTKPYPFPYFERALRLRAAQQGIVIP